MGKFTLVNIGPSKYACMDCGLLDISGEVWPAEDYEALQAKLAAAKKRLEIERPHPFADGYDIVDFLKDGIKANMAALSEVHRQLTEARVEIERANDGIRYWTKQCASLVSQIEIANAEIERLRKENEALKATLFHVD